MYLFYQNIFWLEVAVDDSVLQELNETSQQVA
jgi:hypothetical protein